MGKGDRKTRKGKIAIRSYGNSRPHTEVVSTAAKPATTAARTATKSAAKKPAAKKKA